RLVRDVNDRPARIPEPDVGAVAVDDRTVHAVLIPGRPGRRLAARGPGTGDPPAADLGRPRRVGHVDDLHDPPGVAVHLGRQVGVLPVGKPETVHAAARGTEEADLR